MWTLIRAVLSGSLLFANAILSETLVYEILWHLLLTIFLIFFFLEKGVCHFIQFLLLEISCKPSSNEIFNAPVTTAAGDILIFLFSQKKQQQNRVTLSEKKNKKKNKNKKTNKQTTTTKTTTTKFDNKCGSRAWLSSYRTCWSFFSEKTRTNKNNKRMSSGTILNGTLRSQCIMICQDHFL